MGEGLGLRSDAVKRRRRTAAFGHAHKGLASAAEPSGGPSKPGRLLRSGRWAKGSAIYPPLKAYGTVGPTIALPAVVRLLAAPKQIETISVSQDHNRAALPLGLTCLRCFLLETHKHGPEHMRDTDIV